MYFLLQHILYFTYFQRFDNYANYRYIIWVILACLDSYLLGSIPFSVWIGRLVKGIDLREHNTGNPGAINAIKTFGTAIGLVVLLLDIFKGFLVILTKNKAYWETSTSLLNISYDSLRVLELNANIV